MYGDGLLIESESNKTIKEINALRQKKERDKTGLFILEGERLVNEIPEGYDVKYIAASDDYSGKMPSGARVITVKSAVFRKLSETVNSQGILAVCAQPSYDAGEALNVQNPLFVLLENVADPGNMGTIIRTADAAGADGIFISKGCVDIYNPKTVRATMGSIFHLPLYKNTDIKSVLTEMRKKGIMTYAAHLKGKKTPYQTDMTGGCAIVIGNEANGLTDETTALTDTLVKIPMPGRAESMNAGIAAGILIYEAVRQRL